MVKIPVVITMCSSDVASRVLFISAFVWMSVCLRKNWKTAGQKLM